MGSSTVRSGIFLATDRRLIFYAKKMGGYDFESFPYANVSSFEQSKGMMGHSMRFFASGNTRMIDGQISGQSARVISEYSRSLAVWFGSRSEGMEARIGLIPNLIAQVRFSSLAPPTKTQAGSRFPPGP
jgi:hypothetical protein